MTRDRSNRRKYQRDEWRESDRCGPVMEQEDVARLLGIRRDVVSKIERRALAKLREGLVWGNGEPR